MKHYASSVAVALIVVLGYSTGNYGGGFIASPNLDASQNSTASVSSSNYGGGFIAAPNLNSASTYSRYSYTNPRNYGGGFIQSPPIWRGYSSYFSYYY